VFGRRRRNDGPLLTLTAAGQLLKEPGQPAPRDLKQRKRTQETWQTLAWEHYDRVPQIWFAHNYVANALRRVRLVPAVQPDASEPPRPLDPVDDGQLFARAQLALDELRGPDGTHGELVHDMALQLGIPGEGYFVGYEDDDGAHWVIASVDELQFLNGSWVLKEDADDRQGVVLGEDSTVARFWRQHPRWRNRPDSSMRVIADDAEELLLLNQLGRVATRSRLNAGLLLVPQELSVRRPQAPGMLTGAQEGVEDPFVSALVDYTTSAVGDEVDPGTVAPAVVRGKGDYLAQVRHLTFGRLFDRVDAERVDEKLRAIAAGIDLPPEVVLGISDLNHWSAWQVTDDAFKAHLEPLVQLIVGAITEVYLAPALNDVTDQRVITWFDPSALVSRPNRMSDALTLYDKIELSGDALRRIGGHNEDDAPDEDERLRRIAQAQGTQAMMPVASGEVKSMTQALDDAARRMRAAEGGGGDDGAIVSDDGDTGPSSDPPDPTEDAEDTEPGPPAVVASGNVNGEELGRRLEQMDHDLMTRLTVASDGAVRRAVEKAGARLRRRLPKNGTFTAQARNVPNHELCRVLGMDVVRKYFQTDEELVDDVAATVLPLYTSWTARTQTQVRQVVREAAEDDEEEDEELERQQDEDRQRGAELLALLLLGVATSALYSPRTGAPVGEQDPTVLVPTGDIRDVLTVAGGGQPVSQTGAIPSADRPPPGGVATGETARTALVRVGLKVSSWVWVYGDPGSRGAPFEAHERLDGVRFSSWDDPRLSVQPGDGWLGVSHYYPGDHLYCQCDFIPVFEEDT